MNLILNGPAVDALLRSPGVKRHEMTVAETAASVTRRLASVLNEDHVKVVETEDGVAVVVDSPYWHWDEFGTRTTAARAPLRRGMEAAGLPQGGR